MIFFTDITTDASHYCLLNINKYNDKRKATKNLIFIDPGVYELTKQIEYSNIEFLHEKVNSLAWNEYISIDYPCDMNREMSEEFIEKTAQNNFRYMENVGYICTIQFDFQNFASFKYSFLTQFYIFADTQKIVGIGNLCQIMYPNAFTEQVFNILLRYEKHIYWIHFYGLALRLIKRYIPLFHFAIISVDSTKWTRACHSRLKTKYGLACTTRNRNEFFLEYMKTLPGVVLF